MAQDVRHFLAREAGIDRDQHPAGQRHREMGDEHLGQVRHQVGNAVARFDAAGPQRPRHPHRLRRELGVGDTSAAVDHGHLVRPHASRSLQERQRCLRRIRYFAHVTSQGGEPGLRAARRLLIPCREACPGKRRRSRLRGPSLRAGAAAVLCRLTEGTGL